MFRPMAVKKVVYANTKAGTLRGFESRDIYAFLGVPYGKAKRWQQAEPVEPWKGIRNAVQFGNRAFPSQHFTPWDSCGVPHELYSYSEDCLNINIWSPTLDPEAKKPVLFWIHGGGYSTGSAMEMQAHDGEDLARFGDVVVVTVNHRLNIFGFFDLSDLGAPYENSGNCGISDLELALRYVRENIATFGGDSDNVTIFGQSGGGGKVRALLQTPSADGLFHKAIIMSGAGFHHRGEANPESGERSREVREFLFEKFNTRDIHDLEALQPEELLDAVQEYTSTHSSAGLMFWKPVANHYYLGDEILHGMRDHALKVPVMIGCTISEFPKMRVRDKYSYSEDEQLEIIRQAFPAQDTERLVQLFREAWPNKCVTDVIETGGMLGRSTVMEFADERVKQNAAPTYVYLFAHEFPQDGGRGAWHCADIPVVFHNSVYYPESFHNGLLDGLEDAMSMSWVNFARFGTPQNDYLKAEWPEWKDRCATMVFDDDCYVKYDFGREMNALRDSMQLTVIEQ